MKKISEQNGHWTLDRRVPIALLLAIGIQLVAAVVWATELNARVGIIEERSISLSGASERFVRLEERLDAIKDGLQNMKRELDRLNDRLAKR